MPLISVDGVDGSGKSTLAANLQSSLIECQTVPEFSDTEMGNFLKHKVTESPHFIAQSELAQTLVFLAEHAERMNALSAESLSDSTTLQIVERGWLSKYAYQVCVLERRFSSRQSHEVVTAILSMIPSPDASILLRVDEKVLRTRIVGRTAVVDDAYFSFLRRADELMVAAVSNGYDALVIDTSDMTAEEVTTAALPFVRAAR
jgi:thymidylate kinase